jgi:predicted RNase H-like HicB family nuclease
MKEYEYPAVVAFGYGDGELWVANFPGLSGCWVEGKDREDVLKRAPAVLMEYIRSCIDAEWPVPEAPDSAELQDADAGEIIMIKVKI